MDLKIANVVYNDQEPNELLVKLYILESAGEKEAIGLLDVTIKDDDVKAMSLNEIEEQAIKIAREKLG